MTHEQAVASQKRNDEIVDEFLAFHEKRMLNLELTEDELIQDLRKDRDLAWHFIVNCQ